jgi:hypothetical protein
MFNYTNNDWSLTNNSGIPLTNLTGIFPGGESRLRLLSFAVSLLYLTRFFPFPVCNTELWTPVSAPVDTPGAGGGATFFSPLLTTADKNITSANLPAPVNLTAMGVVNPIMINPNITTLVTNSSSSSSSNGTSFNGTSSGSTTGTTASGAEIRLDIGRGVMGVAAFAGLVALVL